jgi:hypothetical protein
MQHVDGGDHVGFYTMQQSTKTMKHYGQGNESMAFSGVRAKEVWHCGRKKGACMREHNLSTQARKQIDAFHLGIIEDHVYGSHLWHSGYHKAEAC